MTKLNLGCGRRPLEGYINVDCHDVEGVDCVFDLSDALWPWPPGSVDEIKAFHVLEHLPSWTDAMQSMYAIMKPGALLYIAVPHHWSDGYMGDPTHVRPVTLAGLQLFSKKKCAEFAEKGWPNTPLAEMLEVDFEVEHVEFDLTPRYKGLTGANLGHAISSYLNVVDEVRFTVRRV
jgi:SAM-dependent methyltransferase